MTNDSTCPTCTRTLAQIAAGDGARFSACERCGTIRVMIEAQVVRGMNSDPYGDGDFQEEAGEG